MHCSYNTEAFGLSQTIVFRCISSRGTPASFHWQKHRPVETIQCSAGRAAPGRRHPDRVSLAHAHPRDSGRCKPKYYVRTPSDNGRRATRRRYLGEVTTRDSWLSHCGRPAMELALRDQSNDDDSPVVLVIDDDPDVREGLRALFETVNLRTRSFRSVPEFLRSQRPDQVSCLILDVRLPGLSGLEFQANVQIDIPIIFITGHGDIPMSVKAMKAGAVEFLTKPFREQELLDAVRIALDRDRERVHRNESAHDLRSRFDTLSTREQEVMTLVATGMMNKQVAAELGIVEVTVKVHRHKIMKKLGANSLADLVRMADALGLVATIKTNEPGNSNSRHSSDTGTSRN
jgi:RNA polymerase sigma factor (sigma-70 family)